MDKVFLKILRKLYGLIRPYSVKTLRNSKMVSHKEYANTLIYEYLMSDQPCMIGRFGSTEMLCLTNYLGVKSTEKNRIIKFVKNQHHPWWWQENTLNQIRQWSGFFPATKSNIEIFCELMIKDMQELDLLGSWLNDEIYFDSFISKSKKVMLEDLEPFFSAKPWTRALEGKKVLVIHPFAESIVSQYSRRNLIFSDNFLPAFELKTIKAVQSIAGEYSEFNSWFDALENMKNQMDMIDYDIAIIGCGAYGFPLAAYAKKKGRKAIHLAGVTQLLFGIKGKRWEQYLYWPYQNLFNEYWVRPKNEETPQNSNTVEGACYW